MKRFLLIGFIYIGSLYALDTKDMFFTPQPYNMYSEPLEEPKKKKEQKKEEPAKDDKKTAGAFKDKLQGGDLFFNAYMGFVSYTGYNRPGNALSVSVEKHFPKLSESYPGLLLEGDYSYQTRPNTDGLEVLPDVQFNVGGLYGGYIYNMNDKTKVKWRVGVAYISEPTSAAKIAGGASVFRKLAGIKVIDLAGDLSIKGDIWYISAGVRYMYQKR